MGGFTLPPDWPDAHDARFLRLRQGQLARDPSLDAWLVRGMVLRSDAGRRMIGHVGYHGPPLDGFVEIGYTVFADMRRQGYATEAVQGLIDHAAEKGVPRIRLSIAPGNEASLALARKLGFERVGEQIDEEDGLEYVFERSAG
jgi:RimJ/RimL family protein N-acetyltransferase